jgi:hypothetical protein
MTAEQASPRVFLHIGAPKSGTTFIQRALWRNREQLRKAGFTCPGKTQREMFHAAIEVRGTFANWGLQEQDLAGTWARLCAQARSFHGTTIMSHELLAAASPEEASAALAELEGVDLHIVLTARDLGRQVMSEWQERIKNGSTKSFAKFQKTLSGHLADHEFDGLFWRYQDIPEALARWGSQLPPDKVHVVVAPPSGADPLVLWRRFGETIGFDADALDPTTSDGVTNQTLGMTQIALLRQVNKALDGRIKQPAYGRVVKQHFGQDLLARSSSPRPVCPPELLAELRTLAQGWAEEITARGYTVHGDLADLVPAVPASPAPAPDDVDPDDLAATSAAVIAELLVEVAGQRARLRRLTAPPAASDGTAMPEVDPAGLGRRAGQAARAVGRRFAEWRGTGALRRRKG